MEMVQATLQLYIQTFLATIRSFTRCWMISIAVVLFTIGMFICMSVAGSLGMLGGLLLGIVNALVIGATLRLVEEAVKGSRQITFQDIGESFGRYFWEVIGVGFTLWIPVWAIEQGMSANPNGPFIATAVFLLGFILLNPAPEVIYQVRHDSPLDVIRESYEFVIENWIEWFLPIALFLAPIGLNLFFALSSSVGRAAGLNFFEILKIPITVISALFQYLGLSGGISKILTLALTPPLVVLMLIFRGHLFSALHGSSRRGRLFQSKML